MDAAADRLESIRSRLEHEDNLVNHRVSWILTSQAFLLTGYAILLNTSVMLRSELHGRHHSLLMWLIPLIGIITVLVLWLAIVGALITMRDLRAAATTRSGAAVNDVHGRKITRWLGLSAPLVIPAVFLVTWLLIALA